MMHINLNNASFSLAEYNTDFVQFWKDWAFVTDDCIQLDFDTNKISAAHTAYVAAYNRLMALLTENNKLVHEHGLEDNFIFVLSDFADIDFLAATHEQWAHITKQACEKHTSIYDAAVERDYQLLDQGLQHLRGYEEINAAVHCIEFMFKFVFIHNITIPQPAPNRSDYTIIPNDTSFIKDTVGVPYYDIGRPQYEKFLVSGAVKHSEISNYLAIANRIELTSCRIQDVIDDNFIKQCADENVEVFGPYLNVASTQHRNPSMLGCFLLQHYSPDTPMVLWLQR
mgnify:CR=1 FL=1|tara:strand:+ start:704 stop:1552 length:849 start_codon:yes stop_codon:yes gene_type:complete